MDAWDKTTALSLRMWHEILLSTVKPFTFDHVLNRPVWKWYFILYRLNMSVQVTREIFTIYACKYVTSSSQMTIEIRKHLSFHHDMTVYEEFYTCMEYILYLCNIYITREKLLQKFNSYIFTFDDKTPIKQWMKRK